MRISPCRMSQNVCQAESVSYTWQIPQRYRLNRPYGARFAVEQAPPGSTIFPVQVFLQGSNKVSTQFELTRLCSCLNASCCQVH